MAVCCLALGLLAALGCSGSGSKAEVSGTVKLDGQLIEEGSIQFIPVEGTTGPSTGAAIKDGQYHIPRAQGAAIGKNRVELRSFKMSGRKIQDPTAPPGTLTEARVQAFPPEYNDRSTVVKEIQAGSNTIDFDVSSKSKPR
jgi:hypothetical protein